LPSAVFYYVLTITQTNKHCKQKIQKDAERFFLFFTCILEKSVLHYKNNNNIEGYMLQQKAITCNTTATLCTTTNTIFVHKHNKAHLQYTVNSNSVLRNVNAQQLKAFYSLPNTIMQRAKTFPTKHAQQCYKIMRNKFVHSK